ncbi:MAG: hypothetical protein HC905_31435 [Bacteroidales bacterium]|nr:hypothetical protein [Bacteroidales bacterium]
MDNRKVLNPTSSDKEPNYSLWIQFLVYFILGGFAAIILGQGNAVYPSFFLVYLFLMFMLTMNMVADFSTLLFDTRDNTIILPRPVTEATFLSARIIHISSYIFGFTLSFAIIPVIVVIVKYNLAAAFFLLLNVFLSAILSVFLTHLIYLGLMRFLSGERFKDILGYFQILITIFLFGGYQIIIRSLDTIEKFSIAQNHWWLHFYRLHGWLAVMRLL